jgi:hypothetical protein
MAWEVAIALSLVGVAMALFYMGSHLEKDHYPLKLLFLLIGMFVLTANLALTRLYVEANAGVIGSIATGLTGVLDNVYVGFLWVTIFVVAYFLIYFLWKVVEGYKAKNEEEG